MQQSVLFMMFLSLAAAGLTSDDTGSGVLRVFEGSAEEEEKQRGRRGDGKDHYSRPNTQDLKLISMSPDYNYHEYPPTSAGEEGFHVGFQINLRNVLEVNEVSQICSLEMTIRMYWIDTRIAPRAEQLAKTVGGLDYVTLNPKAAEHLWIPDIFIDQAKELRIPTYFNRPASIRIYNNSRIRYATRVNFDVACNMEFHLYPHDVQTCEIKLESFGYTSKQMNFSWMEGNNINQNISLPQFDLEVRLGDDYATDYYDLAYPGVIMKIILRRKMSFHVMQTYIPSLIFVTLAWLTIFIPPDQVPGRITMTMTTLLTVTAMFGSVRSNVPRVSYVSLLDIWMFSCIVFVFIVIIHFILVLILIRRGHKASSEYLENAGAICIPAMYAVFNALYWSVLFGESPS